MKNFILRIALLLLIGFSGLISQAGTITRGGIEYNLNDYGSSKTATVVRPINTWKTSIIIPAVVTDDNGVDYSVTAVQDHAFKNYVWVSNVSIPETVTRIGKSAFAGCTDLTKCTLPSLLKRIEEGTFTGCSSLRSLTIPESVTFIGNSAFNGCSSLASINIPENDLIIIGESAFSGCSALATLEFNAIHCFPSSSSESPVFPSSVSHITFGDKVQIIPDYFLAKGSKIENLIFPESLTSIGTQAFYKNTALTSINIPEDVTSIGSDAFSGCYSLKSLEYEAVECIANGSSEIPVFPSSLSNITFGDKVKIIPDYFLAKGSKIENLIFPESLTSIGDWAFHGCSSLALVNIPENVSSIGSAAFEKCSSIISVNIPENVSSIGSGAFRYCAALASLEYNAIECSGSGTQAIPVFPPTISNIKFGDKVKIIPDYFLIKNARIDNLALPESLISIGDWSFHGCSSLAKVNIPENVTSIGTAAFEECSSLTSVHIPEGVTSISGQLFHSCTSLASVNIPESVTSIGVVAFSGCNSLRSIKIPENVTSIGFGAFENCSSLTSVTYNAISCNTKGMSSSPLLPASVTNLKIGPMVTQIPEYFLSLGSKIVILELPSSLISIGDYAFNNCSRIKSVIIPRNVSSVGDGAFNGYSSLLKSAYPASISNPFPAGLTFSYPEDYEIDESGVIYNSDFSGLNFAPITVTDSYTIPESVRNIEDNAFKYCSSITSIHISENVSSIGESAFDSCSSLTSINIPESVASIGVYAFYGCSALAKLEYNAIDCKANGTSEFPVFPSSVSIVTLGDNVIKIPDYFLADGNRIENMVLPESLISIGESALSGCSSLQSLVYNSIRCDAIGSAEHPVFPSSIISLTIGPKIVQIPAYFLSSGSDIEKLELPSSLISIGDYAFNNCSRIKTVIIPRNVTSVGDGAFNGCSSLIKSAYPASISNPFPAGLTFSYPEDYEIDESGVIYNSDFSGLNFAPITVTDSYTIPESVRNIEDNAFKYCSSITSIHIPENVSSIGESIFDGCSSLTSINIPESMTSIDVSAFYGCSALASLEYNAIDCHVNGSSEISVFPSSISNISFGDKVIKIPDYFLANCNKIEIVVLPESLTSIGTRAFSGCSGLKSINIPGNVASMGASVFDDCSALATIEYDAIDCEVNGSNNNPIFPSSISNISFGDRVKNIPDYFLTNCNKVEIVVLPESLTSIGSHAFRGCSALTSITIPGNVASIGADAFYDCPGLVTLEFNAIKCNNLGESYKYLFPPTIANLSLGEKVTKIPANFLSYGSQLENVSFPESLIAIERCAFERNNKLTSIHFPENLTAIGSSAFEKCTGLTSVSFSENLQYIYNYAFRSCSGLTSIIIPKNVTEIDSWAFWECTSLIKSAYPSSIPNPFYNGISVEYPVNSEIDAEGVIYDSDFTNIYFAPITLSASYKMPETVEKIGNSAFSLCSSLTTVNIPGNVTSIGGSAFKGCSSLSSINIPENVTTIGESAFNGCSSLSSINIPENVTSIGGSAFSYCSSLTTLEYKAITCATYGSNLNPVFPSSISNITIGDKIKTIPDYFLGSGSKIENLILPETLTSIGESSFKGSSSLYSINIPENVTTIGESAFKRCSSLSSINIPENVISIGESAFLDCSSLGILEYNAIDCQSSGSTEIPVFPSSISNVRLGDNVIKIPDYFLGSGSKIENLVLPETLSSIGKSAFRGSSSLVSIIIPETVTSIGESAFRECSSLVSINIPKNVTSINSFTFYDCSLLAAIIIPENMTSIGEYAFGNCSSLVAIRIPENVISIGSHAFRNCSSLSTIIYEAINCNPKNTSYSPLFPTIISVFPSSVSNIIFGDKVTHIPDNFLADGSKIDNLILPETLISIGDCAFYGCSAAEVIIPNSVAKLGKSAFSRCLHLQDITLGSNISTLPNSIFWGCSSLKKISIPGSVSYIDRDAFEGCTSLSKVCFEEIRDNTGLPIDSELDIFADYKPMFIDCPLEEVFIGRRLRPSHDFKSWYSPFEWNNSLKRVEISDVENIILSHEFRGCSNLESIIMGGGVTDIGEDAFTECSSLKSVSVGKNVKTIEQNAFNGCTSINHFYSFSETPPVCGSNALDDINKSECQLYVPAQSIKAYKSAAQWEDFYYVNGMDSELGDSNGNGRVNVADAVNIANYVIGNEVDYIDMKASDVDEDGSVTISDTSTLVTMILDRPTETPEVDDESESYSLDDKESFETLRVDDFESCPGETVTIPVRLENANDYVAMQGEVTVPEGMEIEEVAKGEGAEVHQIHTRKINERTVRFILFDPDNRRFGSEEQPILLLAVKTGDLIDQPVKVANALVSDPESNERELISTGGFYNVGTDVDAIASGLIIITPEGSSIILKGAAGLQVVLYDTLGNIVRTMTAESDSERIPMKPGIYIVTAGPKTVKVEVK